MYIIQDLSKRFQYYFQDPATPAMEGIINLHNDIFFILIFVFVIVFYFFCTTLLNTYYFQNNLQNLTTTFFLKNYLNYTWLNRYVTHFSTLEFFWTLTPCFFLVYIAVHSFYLLYGMDEGVYTPLTVKVVGHQWYWTYEYNLHSDKYSPEYHTLDQFNFESYMLNYDNLSEGDLRLLQLTNQVYMPMWLHTKFYITSADVLHSWAIPSLGIKCDAVPGRINQIHLFMKRAGVFHGQCSEICGVHHAFMPIILQVLPPDMYVKWSSFFFHLPEVTRLLSKSPLKSVDLLIEKVEEASQEDIVNDISNKEIKEEIKEETKEEEINKETKEEETKEETKEEETKEENKEETKEEETKEEETKEEEIKEEENKEEEIKEEENKEETKEEENKEEERFLLKEEEINKEAEEIKTNE